MDVGLGGWFLSLAAMILVVLLPIVVIALGIRLGLAGRDDPRRRLRERLARGEITQAEFDNAIRALGG